MKAETSALRRFLNSFRHAIGGLGVLLRNEQNGRIHVVVMILVIAASFWLGISSMEWVLLVICFGLVISAELMNTAMEKLCDHVTAEYHVQIKTIKDLSAAAVLVMAVVAVVVGLIIFIPYIQDFYQL